MGLDPYEEIDTHVGSREWTHRAPQACRVPQEVLEPRVRPTRLFTLPSPPATKSDLGCTGQSF